ncbi:hypothetical protein JRO89_XS07G0006100 [Xanthoceras sorbifolium]|uniref:Homeobox domain-containing protein n=1 Tax=Xanthoceras sorbifolium TaxID=99658 RepID=A0ABQ8HRQ4_9ROSI|nr:hypothetical protein JRO89_XS07G0006100 [Xanthoceras sorbifolium]
MMEWNISTSVQEKQQKNEGGEMMVVEGLYLKVMTDEQMELLRKQIAVYAIICEQLVDMHKSFSAQYDIAGLSLSLSPPPPPLLSLSRWLCMRLGNPYFDPFMACGGGQKITARQRWTPTPAQLQILERVYDECNGNPGKQKILEMTAELVQHGQISETNVYNWFQNRRARIKRKQSGVAPNPAESEAEKHVLLKKTTTQESIQSFDTPAVASIENNIYFQSPDIAMEQMIGKMDVAGIFSPHHWQIDRYDMLG